MFEAGVGWSGEGLPIPAPGLLPHYRANESRELLGAEFENNWSSRTPSFYRWEQLNGPERAGMAQGHTACHGRAGTRTCVFPPSEQHSFYYVTLKVLNNPAVIVLRAIVH